MCGISGIINLNNAPVSEKILSDMNSSQIHRGPNEGYLKIFGNVGFAHRRLSIIDLDNGKQPMSNEDENIWLTFNGEIYNHVELRKRLLKRGHIFKTSSDSEVILHLYEEYGRNCIKDLEGMFAFAVYDRNKQIIFIARDRLGQKPLHYYKNNDIFIFSSELQALIKHSNVDRTVNKQAVHDYLTLQYIPQPHTIYKNVFKLPPASFLELNIQKKEFKISKYWQCDYKKKSSLSYDDAKHELRFLLEKSVNKRLMSDVPLGAFLSGGVDSTIISGLMSKLTKEPVKTFTIGFNEDKYDERKYAKIASERFKTDHYEKIVDPSDFSIVKKLVKNYGEPYSDASMLPTYLLSKFAREKVTVALSGDGADELFAGYYRYMAYKHAGLGDMIPKAIRKCLYKTTDFLLPPKTEERTTIGKIRRLAEVIASSKDKRYLSIIDRCGESLKTSLYGSKMKDFTPNPTQKYMQALYSSATALNSVETIMEADLHSYLPGDILTKIDIASMANSLELRSPFMDHEVVSFAASLPLKYKQGFKSRKKILLDSCSDIIPKELLHRPKMGFGVPIARWLRNEWKEISTDILLNGKSIKDGFFDQQSVSDILIKHQSMQADNSYIIWALIIFELWYEDFFE